MYNLYKYERPDNFLKLSDLDDECINNLKNVILPNDIICLFSVGNKKIYKILLKYLHGYKLSNIIELDGEFLCFIHKKNIKISNVTAYIKKNNLGKTHFVIAQASIKKLKFVIVGCHVFYGKYNENKLKKICANIGKKYNMHYIGLFTYDPK